MYRSDLEKSPEKRLVALTNRTRVAQGRLENGEIITVSVTRDPVGIFVSLEVPALKLQCEEDATLFNQLVVTALDKSGDYVSR